MIKQINKLKGGCDAQAIAAKPMEEVLLLREIRDGLKK
jgi:large-conductance mechanosensitive channel